MLALNLGGVRLPWTSPPILAFFAIALLVGCAFVVRLLTAPEPLIPIAILRHPVVRCAIAANAFGWGAMIGLNIMLPIYLQGVLGLSPTQAGLSLVAFMVAMNSSAGLAGQVLGRVRHYKLLPMLGLLLSASAVMSLSWRADRMTPLSFELTVILIGMGFGPLPSVASVAMQNVVPRHQLGISIGSMNFTRNLNATMLIAVFGAIALAGVRTGMTTAVDAAAFSRVFVVAAASFAAALIALALMEQKPLMSNAEMNAQ
jgi:predicted MFS family arabinose efflux permease